jgi:uncharacterized protein YcfJ
MSRKFWIPAVAVGLAVASTGALADHDRDGYRYDDEDRYADYDYARVVDVEPLRRRIRVSEPVRECWDEVDYRADGPTSSNHIGGTLVGALIGGALGNQVGHGHGRQVARAAGAIIGGAIGHSASQQRQRERERYGDRYGDRERVYERCEVRYRDSYEERIDGYEVTYEYAGRRYVTEMPYDPGDRIRIRVDVTPTGG